MLSKLSKLKQLHTRQNWLSFFAGLSLVFAYAPFSFWPIVFVAIPVWLYQLNGMNTKSAWQNSFMFGFGWFASGISWVHVSIDEFGGMPLVVSILLMLLLCLYLALFPALAGYLAAKVAPRKQAQLWLIPALWTATEYLRSVFLTGFPWLSFGYSQIDSPLAALAPVIGEIGITFVLLVLCVAITKIALKKQLNASVIAIVVSIGTIAVAKSTNWVMPTGEQKRFALVQGNIAQSIKWNPSQELPTMLKYLDLSKENLNADVILWPESAIPVMEVNAQAYLELVNDTAVMEDTSIITGIIDFKYESERYFNNLIVLGKYNLEDESGGYEYGNANRYSKYHLLPIGEFVPFGDLLRPLAPFFNLPMSSFSRGDYQQANLVANGINMAPLICFEIAFPEQLAANFSASTDVIMTVSNDAWFGRSHGPHQHLEIARMRALEFGRPMIRSTNTGLTAIADHTGQLIGQVPQFEEAVLNVSVDMTTGMTPFAQYARSLPFGLACIFGVLVLLCLYARDKSDRSNESSAES